MTEVKFDELKNDECPCRKKNSIVTLGRNDYTMICMQSDDDGVMLYASGDDCAIWKPIYCPVCGRKIRYNALCQKGER